MEVTVLGTGAAEGVPGLFCECTVCREAAARGGKDFRMRASYQFGEELKVDWPPDSLAQMQRFGLDYSRLRHLLITHSHSDHFYPRDLDVRRPGFSVVTRALHLYGNEATLRAAQRTLKRWRRHHLTMHRVGPGGTYNVAGYEVLALPASHAPLEKAMNFIIGRDGFAVLIGHDTGWWSDEAWRLLDGRRVDAALMDCTYGARDERQAHMGAPALVDLKRVMLERGVIDDSSRFIATHFSHNGGLLHQQLEELLTPHGIEVAHDGLRIRPEGAGD